jgi:hypothetical protein
MKLQRITIDNLLGITSVDLKLDRPVSIFCGANFSGKSSVRDAIELALTGEIMRVSKKQAAELIHDGADSGGCEITDGNGEIWRVIINSKGKVVDAQKGATRNPAVPYALNGQRFAGSDPNERRALLYGLMGVKTAHDDIARRMLAMGCDADKVQRITPMLRAGWDAACTDAKAKATQGKGAWQQITGEAYGSEKVKTWRAEMPSFDKQRAHDLAVDVEHADIAIGQWQHTIGALQAKQERRDALKAQLPGLAAKIELIERAETKLATDKQALLEWSADLTKTMQAAGAAPRVGLLHDLARCLANMVRTLADGDEEGLFGHAPEVHSARAALANYEREHGSVNAAAGGDEKARARLPKVKESHDLLARSVANDERDLAALQKAQTDHAAIMEELAQPFDAAELSAAHSHIDTISGKRAIAVAELDKIRTLRAASESAQKRTEDAASVARDTAEWTAIGEALSPEGIPAALVAEALGPLNERLAQSALDTDWRRVYVDSDMTVRADNDRQYALMSESERWRADAMLAEAIAFLSGTKLLVLDRFDVLDLPARAQLLGWLDVLASSTEIEAALIFGTLRTVPGGLPETARAYWIEAGALVTGTELAEAAS